MFRYQLFIETQRARVTQSAAESTVEKTLPFPSTE
jgi:hypothetical protein